MADKHYLNKAQLKAELEKCLHCPSKPCLKACPIGCNPHDFIEAANTGDLEKAARLILENNPLGQTCGLVCPEGFCMKACLRAKIDHAIKIPAVQATILSEVRKKGLCPLEKQAENGLQIAVAGSGPAGMAAAAFLSRKGCRVTVFEQEDKVGGAMKLIPDFRLAYADILQDWENINSFGGIDLKLESKVEDFEALLAQGFDGVIAAIGEAESAHLGIEGEEHSITYFDYLKNPEKFVVSGNAAIIGGGAVAVDCAVTAKRQGADYVEMIVRRRVPDMRITAEERNTLLEHEVDITSMTRLCKIEKEAGGLMLHTCKTRFVDGKLQDIPGAVIKRPGFALVVMAVGSRRPEIKENERIIYAGDCVSGASTVVEAAASGKRAAEQLVQFLLNK